MRDDRTARFGRNGARLGADRGVILWRTGGVSADVSGPYPPVEHALMPQCGFREADGHGIVQHGLAAQGPQCGHCCYSPFQYDCFPATI